MADALLLVRKSITSGKKVLCHGLGHFAAYFALSTNFDKKYTIIKEPATKQVDFEWNEQTGDLKLKGQTICNSGIKVTHSNRPFHGRSSHAVSNGLTLSSKFDYVVFDAKSGSRLLQNIEASFSVFWKHKLFCTHKQTTQAKV